MEGAMAQILIRNLDETVMARIKARAKTNKRSAEAEVRNILTDAAAPVAKRKSLVSMIGAGKPGRTQAEINRYVKNLRSEWGK
jgi:plasmid stability protein